MKIGAKVIVYNHVMRERRKVLKLTQKKLADMVGIAPTSLGEIERLNIPHVETGKLREAMEGIASILLVPYSEIFPEEYIAALIQKRLPRQSSFEWRGEISLETLGAGESAVVGLIEAPDLEDIVDGQLLKEELDNMLADIPRRERLIIRLRIGHLGHPAMKLEEVADVIGVTRERVRQLEAMGYSRLRHPARQRRLRHLREEAEDFEFGPHDPPRSYRFEWLINATDEQMKGWGL